MWLLTTIRWRSKFNDDDDDVGGDVIAVNTDDDINWNLNKDIQQDD